MRHVCDLFGSTMQPGLASGHMRRRVQAFDWASTPLGSRAAWPAALRLVVDTVLDSGFPMAVRWGPDLINIYNDAYGRLFGDKHPAALGRPLREIWPEIWDQLGPLSLSVLRGEREGFFAEDHAWLIERYGVPEEARFTISYSPIPEPGAENGIGGLLVTVFETTERVRKREDAARAHRSAGSGSAAAHARARPHLDGVGGPARRHQFRGPFHQRQSGLEQPARLERGRDQAHACRASCAIPTTQPRRTPAARGWRRACRPCAWRIASVHKDGSWRWLAWTMTADDGLIYVAGRHITNEKWAARAAARKRAAIPSAGRRRHRLRDLHARSRRHRHQLERRRRAHQGLQRANEIVGRHFSLFYTPEDRAAGEPERALAVRRRCRPLRGGRPGACARTARASGPMW